MKKDAKKLERALEAEELDELFALDLEDDDN